MNKKNLGTKTTKNLQGRLYRSEKNRLLGGVAGGIGEYFDIDPTIIRVLLIMLVIFGGSGLLLYIILWIIVPTESSTTLLTTKHIKENIDEIKSRAQNISTSIKIESGDKNKSWWAILLVGFGALFLLNNLGILSMEIIKIWPLALIGLGLYLLWKK